MNKWDIVDLVLLITVDFAEIPAPVPKPLTPKQQNNAGMVVGIVVVLALAALIVILAIIAIVV